MWLALTIVWQIHWTTTTHRYGALLFCVWQNAPHSLIRSIVTAAKHGLGPVKRNVLAVPANFDRLPLAYAALYHDDIETVKLLVREYPKALVAEDSLRLTPSRQRPTGARRTAEKAHEIGALLTAATTAYEAEDWPLLATLVDGDERFIRELKRMSMSPERLLAEYCRFVVLWCVDQEHVQARGNERGQGEERGELYANKAAKMLNGDVSLPNASKGMLDGSVMIYKVLCLVYYNATGTIGDQPYA